MKDASDDIIIIGAGICGLSLALALHRRGIGCRVYERAPRISELGVGITLLPHGMREFASLGVADALLDSGIENTQSCFFNRFGQLIYREPRGKFAGYRHPEVGIARGRLQMILYAAALERLGEARIVTGHQCTGVDQDAASATALFVDPASDAALPPQSGRAVIACDGIHSSVRRQF